MIRKDKKIVINKMFKNFHFLTDKRRIQEI